MGIADEIKGPVDLVLLSFPGNQFTGEIAPALGDLVSSGTVRILDLVFITKDADGNVAGVELADLGEAGAAFERHRRRGQRVVDRRGHRGCRRGARAELLSSAC